MQNIESCYTCHICSGVVHFGLLIDNIRNKWRLAKPQKALNHIDRGYLRNMEQPCMNNSSSFILVSCLRW